ncbi:MAG: GCN5 family acetyltransferase [Armatimonadota bacterium]|nr:MAG: GCN5 family acetyltransferase [Armatimonadota bacterium]
MEVRTLHGDEIDAGADVATTAFDCEPGSWRAGWHRTEELCGPGVIWGVYEDGRLVSSCVAPPQRVFAGGRSIQGGFVGGVATLPEERRKGYAEAMLRAALQASRERGVLISYLWPFSYRYYRKLGWELANDGVLVTATADVLGHIAAEAEARDVMFADLDSVMEFYTSQARCFNGMGDRSRAWWLRFVADRTSLKGNPGEPVFCGTLKATALWRDGKVSALMLWRTAEEEDGTLLVNASDTLYSDTVALGSLLQALLARLPGCAKINFGCAPNRLPHCLWDEPRAVSRSLCCGAMARILDVPGFLQATGWEPGVEGRLTLRVSDPLFGEYSGSFEVCNGQAVPSRKVGPELHCSIQTFTQLATGYLPPEEAVSLGRVQASELDAARLLAAASGGLTPFRSSQEPG